jgi:hypothetical protein
MRVAFSQTRFFDEARFPEKHGKIRRAIYCAINSRNNKSIAIFHRYIKIN